MFELSPLALVIITSISIFFSVMTIKLKKNYNTIWDIERQNQMRIVAKLEKVEAKHDRASKMVGRLKGQLRKTQSSLQLAREGLHEKTIDEQANLIIQNSHRRALMQLDLIGRIGTIQNDVWKTHNQTVYKNLVKSSLRAMIGALSKHNIPGHKVEETNNAFKVLEDVEKLLDKEGGIVIETIVAEIHDAALRYINEREKAMKDLANPDPSFVMDEDILSAEIFKPLIEPIITKYFPDKLRFGAMYDGVCYAITEPLKHITYYFNSGSVEEDISSTGWANKAFDLEGKGKEFVHIIVPLQSMFALNVINRKNIAFPTDWK